MARGEAFLELAKDKSGFDLAIGEFRQAARLAPWLPQTHYNLAVIQEKAGQYNEAINSFKLYLTADPNATDAQEVQRRIYKIEARNEIARKQEAEKQRQEQAKLEKAAQEAAIAKQAAEEKMRRFSGKWHQSFGSWGTREYDLRIIGNKFELHRTHTKGRSDRLRECEGTVNSDGMLNGRCYSASGSDTMEWRGRSMVCTYSSGWYRLNSKYDGGRLALRFPVPYNERGCPPSSAHTFIIDLVR